MKVQTSVLTAGDGWTAAPQAKDAQLALVFGASSFLEQPGPFERIAARYPLAQLVGCSSAGEIAGSAIHDDTLVVAAVSFEHSVVRSATVPVGEAADSREAAALLSRELLRPGLRAVLVFSDGLRVNGSELIRGFNESLPPGVLVSGGLAGDGDRFQRTWVLHRGLPRQGHVAAVGFYGERLKIRHGSRGGWDRFGPERRITRSRGNVLFELDGKPALQLYKTYLGERAEDEIEAVVEALPPRTSLVGFYSYGEISPDPTGPCDHHNQTMTLTTLQEA